METKQPLQENTLGWWCCGCLRGDCLNRVFRMKTRQATLSAQTTGRNHPIPLLPCAQLPLTLLPERGGGESETRGGAEGWEDNWFSLSRFYSTTFRLEKVLSLPPSPSFPDCLKDFSVEKRAEVEMSLFCKYRLNEIFIFTWDENVKLCCSFGSWFITFREFLLKCLLQCFSRTLKFLYKVSGMLFIIFLCLYGCPFSFWIVPFFLILFSVIFPFEFFFSFNFIF